eukprot:3714695-Amphidinium_carterae.1
MAVIEIDPELVANTRRNMPMAAHRRYDLYGLRMFSDPYCNSSLTIATSSATVKHFVFQSLMIHQLPSHLTLDGSEERTQPSSWDKSGSGEEGHERLPEIAKDK